MQRNVSSVYENINFKSKICPKLYGPQNYEITAIANRVLTNQQGNLKVKLFYHSANLEGSSAENLFFIQEILQVTSKKEDKV
jgi:hypothetical protein